MSNIQIVKDLFPQLTPVICFFNPVQYLLELEKKNGELPLENVACILSGIFCEYDNPIQRNHRIFLDAELVDVLTEEQLKGIVFHEHGHVINRDLDGESDDGTVVCDLNKELRADNHALSMGVDPQAIWSAIEVLGRRTFRLLFERLGVPESRIDEMVDKVLAEATSSEMNIKRRKALLGY